MASLRAGRLHGVRDVRLSLVGSMGSTRTVWDRTLELIRAGRLPVERVVTSRITLAWMDEDRAALQAHHRLAEAAREWRRLARDDSGLYRGARLAEALDLRDQRAADLNESEREFLEASVALAQRERRALAGARRCRACLDRLRRTPQQRACRRGAPAIVGHQRGILTAGFAGPVWLLGHGRPGWRR